MGQELGFEEWESFLNNASLGVHLVAGDGTIVWANSPELKLLGYESADYIGKNIADFHVDRDVINQILNILTSGGALHAYPARIRAKDGSIKHVLINSNVFKKEGTFVHTRCFTNCISEAVYNQLRGELLGSA
jgi:PAS domain S-box-containing protein